MQLPEQPNRFESRAERLIREAIENGEFDDLAGLGNPVPGAGKNDDDLWWVRSWIERNRNPTNNDHKRSPRSGQEP